MKSIQEAVASVQNAFPSIYTKDDVIKLLESIEITSAPGFSRETIEELIEEVVAATTGTIDRMDTSDLVELGSAEFSLNYNSQIELDNVNVNTDSISEEVESAVQDAINKFFEKMEEDTHHGIESMIVLD